MSSCICRGCSKTIIVMFAICVISFTLMLMNYFICLSMNLVEYMLLCYFDHGYLVNYFAGKLMIL